MPRFRIEWITCRLYGTERTYPVIAWPRRGDPVPLEYSIVSLTYAITSRFDAVIVGLPGAAQDRLRDSSPAT